MEPYVKQDLKLPQIYAQVKLFKTSLSMYLLHNLKCCYQGTL